MHVSASQRRLRSEARMNMYAWSYAKLWCTALQATAGGVRHARHPNSSPRANNRPALGLPANRVECSQWRKLLRSLDHLR
jgi:hypothetical protein